MSTKKYTADDIKLIKDKAIDSNAIDISRNSFEHNLISAAFHAQEFARTLVTNILPEKIKYVVYLGVSYDGNPLEDGEQIFPEDCTKNKRCFDRSEEVVDLLWREGSVPEWINVFVESNTSEYTQIKLDCCGRFSRKSEHIYHAHEGRAPFHVLGPPRQSEFDLFDKKS